MQDVGRPGVHWQRPLKDGRVEFYCRSPDGKNKMRGTAHPDDAAHMRGVFEQHTKCVLPSPEIKGGA